ncbi:MAG: Na+/H+ antiporter NhaC family protein [Melioribacteraceae bacterium]|nr:Na+/H+ antiporter NhaC family protein [Melioribacteraceae bacterium]
MKKLIILILLLFLSKENFSQVVKIPSYGLNDVSFKVKISEIPDTLDIIKLLFVKNDNTRIISLNVINNKVDTTLSISGIGTHQIVCGNHKSEIRIMPGWFSVLPPFIAICLALLIKQVLVSLAAGIFVGAFFIYDYNPFIAVLRLADTFVLNALTDPSHILIMSITLLIGGVIGVISYNGGTAGLANTITKYAKTSRSGMISSWAMGLVIFFDEYANTLIIGNMVKPITDKLKISREKLAFIVDGTASSTASIAIVSTWIGYEIGLIEEGLKIIGLDQNAYDVFIQTIPSRFYPIAVLFFVFITSYLRRDFGPMYTAEAKARKGEKSKEFDTKDAESMDDENLFANEDKAKWYNGAVPIMIFLFGTMIGLVLTGIENIDKAGSTDFGLQNIISNSESNLSLFWACFIAGVVAIIMSVVQKITTLNQAVTAWQKGLKSIVFTCVILVFAWGISSVTTELQTADYLISLVGESIDPHFLPAIIFVICALTSFATGTSWGTMAIVMPIAIPLTFTLCADFGFSQELSIDLLYGVISSILAGAIFGDHCSPISDTTILSSMASGCNHLDHVNTQMPYAILIAVVCLLFGSLPTAYGVHPIIANVIICVLLTVVLIVVGKKLPRTDLG